MPFDSNLQRKIMGRFATGVTVMTTRQGEEDWGMTANAVTSLSLDPPLVLVAVESDSRTHAILGQAGFFALNILRAEQEHVSVTFAADGKKGFDLVRVGRAATGAAVFEDGLAYVDCRVVDTLRGGDHDIFVGEIVAGEVREGRPLVFFDSKYTTLRD